MVRSELRRALLILLVGLALMTAVVGAGAYVVLRASAKAFEQGGWSSDVLSQHDVPRVFGVKFVENPKRYRVRVLDLADASYEVLAEVGPGEAGATFVARNALVASSPSHEAPGPELDAALEELTRLTGQAPSSIKTFTFAHQPSVERQVTMLTVGESTWVVLDASLGDAPAE